MSQANSVSAPKQLLLDIAWSFIGEHLSRAEFDAAVLEDQREFASDTAWLPEQIAIDVPRIHLRFKCPRQGEYEDQIIEIAADDGKCFTQGELLFKIHNAVVEELRDVDHHFFEGLTLYRPPMDEIPPLYDLRQGS